MLRPTLAHRNMLAALVLLCAVVTGAAAGHAASGASASPQQAPVSAQQPSDAAPSALATALARAAERIGDFAADANRRRPALMVGLAGLALPPLLVLAGMLLRLVVARSRRAQPVRTLDPAAVTFDEMPRSAWLELPTVAGQTEPHTNVPIEREVVQIGREDDNDICLADETVHRYHAVIECSRDNGFVITDVSGPDGNGVRINGQRLIKSSLVDGDVVEVGRAKLKFATAA